MTSEITTEFIQANGLTFEVLTCGRGDALALCLHGFPEVAESWRVQMPALAAMGYRVWAPNQRGYGLTTRPEPMRAYALEHLVADVAGLIDASGAASVVLIGHDWGGIVAWTFAMRRLRPLGPARHPQRPTPGCLSPQPASRPDAAQLVCARLPNTPAARVVARAQRRTGCLGRHRGLVHRTRPPCARSCSPPCRPTPRNPAPCAR